ncbi:PilW family protein [Stutzerimonas stutzeri]|uniref:PilW family protein n=1 Tax=Stutzerimonas stutzeri TaxID=316 RepID=UPI002244A4D5|nr:PilW family protein [Stutzerimonas stutzeri]MCW8161170.1 prepilin-type N-terminal cleavage/methylation domain-containing protein [Stutzerimonas stutzeri]
MKRYGLQTGLSLVELMVALAISSFLILGVTQIYIDNKRSYLFQQSQSESIEGSRYILLLLQQELSKAGYRRRPDEQPVAAFPAAPDLAGCGAFSAGETIKRTAPGSVCIRYQPRDHLERSCLGDLPATASLLDDGPYTSAQEIVIERLWFEADSGSKSGSLKCSRVHTNLAGAPLTGRALSTGDLTSGLVDFRYEFGIGSSSDDRSISRYTNEDTSEPILAVRYTALLRSSHSSQREAIDSDTALKKWQDLTGLESSDTQTLALKADDAGQLYHVSQSTVMLRNLMP